MTKHNYFQTFFTLALVALLGSACSPFYDDLSRCHSYLAFSYHADDNETVEHLPEYLHKIDLFIYDEQDALVARHTLSQEELDSFEAPQRPGISFNLQPGAYRAVAVGNLFSESLLVGETTYNASEQVQHKAQPQVGGVVSSGFDSLYLGECPITITSDKREDFVLMLYSQHIKIDARLRFDPKEPAMVILREGEKTLCTVDFSLYVSNAIHSF